MRASGELGFLFLSLSFFMVYPSTFFRCLLFFYLSLRLALLHTSLLLIKVPLPFKLHFFFPLYD